MVNARPGTSEHQLGLAVDFVDTRYWTLDEKQAELPAQKWLMEHCWEYGFILRYPSEKSEITGIIYEPWHYRYVGREIALEIRDAGLTLEEYLETL
jgi:D-alanyl-D-alanine carboxypeptidase